MATTRADTCAKHAEQVRAYLEANLTQDLGMNAVTRAASLSPFYLTRIFKQRYGVPPYRYLIELRIRRRSCCESPR
jgi:AraC family transcriptional regulator